MPQALRKMSVIEMAAIGLTQGISLWLLLRMSADAPLSGGSAVTWMTACFAVLTVPLLWYFTENQLALSRLRRVAIVLGLGLVIPVLLVTEYAVMRQREFMQAGAAPLIAAAVLLFVSVPLLTHLRRGPHGKGYRWHWSYPDLFQTTWRNAIAFVMSLIFGGFGLLLLVVGAGLLKLIGLGVIGQVLLEPPVILGAGAMLFGTAMGIVLTQGAWLIAVRRFLLSRKHGLLPLSFVVLMAWALLMPRIGVPTLLKEHPMAVLLAGLLAFAFAHANIRYQDGLEAQAPSPTIQKLVAIGWLAAIPALGLVALPVGRLIIQQGWSADRLWAVFGWVLGAGYVVGYALSLTRRERGWMWSIAPTNIAMAVLLCVGMLLLATPIGDARSIAAQNQIQRLLNGKVAADAFDYAALARDNDRYGHDALRYLSQLDASRPQATTIIAGARLALDATRTGTPRDPAEIPAGHWQMLPDGAAEQPALQEALRERVRAKLDARIETDCVEQKEACRLWLVDLDGDTQPEAVLILQRGESWRNRVYRWTPATNTLQPLGALRGVNQAWVDAVQRGEGKTVPNRWQNVAAGNTEVRLLLDTNSPAP